MKNFLLFLLIIITTETYASCGVPKLIPDDEQVSLREKIIFTVRDKDFLNNSGLDEVDIELPGRYKDKLLDKAFLTYWDGDKVVLHSSLGLDDGYSYTERTNNTVVKSKVLTFSINRNLSYIPKLTLIFGNMCYNRFQLNIDDFGDFIKLDNDYEWRTERQNYIFVQGRK
jgi:hypothetical protein